MTQRLAYDMMLEVQGLVRSLAVRTTLHRELRIGETFSMSGRRWVVSDVQVVNRKGVDRRLIASEIVPPEASPIAC